MLINYYEMRNMKCRKAISVIRKEKRALSLVNVEWEEDVIILIRRLK